MGRNCGVIGGAVVTGSGSRSSSVSPLALAVTMRSLSGFPSPRRCQVDISYENRRLPSGSVQTTFTPRPGDRSPGFTADVSRCWAMVYDRNLQSTHCHETPLWTGRWFAPRGDKWWRVWACPERWTV